MYVGVEKSLSHVADSLHCPHLTIPARLLRRGGLLCLLLGLALTLAAQSPLDSLERLLPILKGQEKLNLAGELAYQFCYVNTDKAFHYGKIELQLAQELGDSAQIAQAWNDLAAACISSGDFEGAVVLSRRALGTRARLGDSLKVASSLGRLGHALVELSSFDEALTAMLRAARIYEQENQPQYLGMMYNHIGAVHQRQGNHPKAVAYFQQAVATAEAAQDVPSSIAPLSNLGKEYFDQGRKEEAQAIFLRLTRTMHALGIRENLALIQSNLGATYMEEAQYDSAQYYFAAADSLYAIKGDKKGLTAVKVDLGTCLTRMGEFNQAAQVLAEGLRYAEETGASLRLQQAHHALYELAYARGDYKAASDHLAKALAYQLKTDSEAINQQVAEMETRYQTEKKEKDLAVRNQQLAAAELKAKTQQLWLFLLAGGLLLVLGLAFVLVRAQRLRRERVEQRARLALQEERLRISRDLHDHIGAELTLITSSLDALAVETPEAPQAQALQEVGGFSRNAMSQLRETIWAIRSETISVDALSLRLMDYAARLCRPAGIASSVEVEGDADKTLSPLHTIHVYRMAQEAIHNAVKYAACRHLDIRIEARPDFLALRIADDGQGFAQEGGSKGHGLPNMQARAEELGGSLAVVSAPGKGTAVTIRVPI